MVFSSLAFLWMFLPIVFAGYFVVPEKAKNIFLLLGSLFFYAWGEPKYILLMLASILIHYAIGILMEKFEAKKKAFLILAIFINIVI